MKRLCGLLLALCLVLSLAVPTYALGNVRVISPTDGATAKAPIRFVFEPDYVRPFITEVELARGANATTGFQTIYLKRVQGNRSDGIALD